MKKRYAKPPKIAERILNNIALPDEDFSIAGDLEEEFNAVVRENGPFKARLWYWFQILKASPTFLKYYFYWGFIMLGNYFKVAIRNLKKYKGYSFINIAGLAIGMACCLLILLYITDELSYDRYHKKGEQTFRILSFSTIGGTTRKFAATPAALAPALTKSIPEIENFVRLFNFREASVKYKEKNIDIPGFYLVDPSFFELFSYEFVAGNPKTALEKPNSIVLTEEAAVRIFGTEKCLGKSVVFRGGRNRSVEVTGIIKNVPQQSHYNFNVLLSTKTFTAENNNINNQNQGQPNFLEEPYSFGAYSYLLLSKNAHVSEVEKKIMLVVEEQWGEHLRKRGTKRDYPLQPLKEIHLYSKYEAELGNPGNINYIYLFSAIALLVILIACFNFINLSTARSTLRAREVGLRKVFGADRKQMVKQFLSESVILSLLGLILGVLLVILVLPSFNLLAAKEFSIGELLSIYSILGLIAIVLLTGFVAGSFPAFVLSAFKPVNTVRGKSDTLLKNTGMRKFLVVIQFSISIFLIISVFVILKQLDYMKNKDLGFTREQMVAMPFGFQATNQQNNGDREALRRRNILRNNTLKTRILRNPNVISVCLSLNIPGQFAGDNIYIPEGKNKNETLRASVFFTDHDFVKTYGIKIKWGRDFSKDFLTDDTQGIIINESAAKEIGWGSDAIGKRMVNNDINEQRIVIGVIEDFHYKSLKTAINPTVIEINNQFCRFVSARLRPHNVSSTLDDLKKILTDTNPELEFSHFFIDEEFRNKYPNEEIVQTLYSYFGILAVFIACLGLYGLATFVIDRRYKEIGIRKVLGAKVLTIVSSLSKEFMKWVVLANVIAWPAAYYVMNQWLGSFAYRTSIGVEIFIFSGMLAILIALLTVCVQSIKAATTNPVETLRCE